MSLPPFASRRPVEAGDFQLPLLFLIPYSGPTLAWAPKNCGVKLHSGSRLFPPEALYNRYIYKTLAHLVSTLRSWVQPRA